MRYYTIYNWFTNSKILCFTWSIESVVIFFIPRPEWFRTERRAASGFIFSVLNIKIKKRRMKIRKPRSFPLIDIHVVVSACLTSIGGISCAIPGFSVPESVRVCPSRFSYSLRSLPSLEYFDDGLSWTCSFHWLWWIRECSWWPFSCPWTWLVINLDKIKSFIFSFIIWK